MSSVNLLLYKLQSGLCGQLLCSLITGEEEGEKMTLREQAEEREYQLLSPYAAHSAESAGRVREVLDSCQIINDTHSLFL